MAHNLGPATDVLQWRPTWDVLEWCDAGANVGLLLKCYSGAQHGTCYRSVAVALNMKHVTKVLQWRPTLSILQKCYSGANVEHVTEVL